ncbi:MAG: hypothetical protein NTW03_07365 [Verrucomicrobia bacterium]|nr:hypothetical protein [Verrucomicrobiota bacterium]
MINELKKHFTLVREASLVRRAGTSKFLFVLLAGLIAWLVASARLAAAQISDPAGDAGGRCFDVTRLDWDIVGSQVVIRFTFVEDLLQEGWLADVLVSLAIDADRDLQTGFKNAGGLHSRGGGRLFH